MPQDLSVHGGGAPLIGAIYGLKGGRVLAHETVQRREHILSRQFAELLGRQRDEVVFHANAQFDADLLEGALLGKGDKDQLISRQLPQPGGHRIGVGIECLMGNQLNDLAGRRGGRGFGRRQCGPRRGIGRGRGTGAANH